MTTRWLACLLVTAAASTSAAAGATAQTLGEVARAEQARRKSAGKATKTYTNESLKPEPLPSQPPAPAGGRSVLDALAASQSATPTPGDAAGAAPGTTAAASGSGAAPGTATALPTTEAGWRGRIAELKANVERQRILADALQSRVNAALLDFVNHDDPAQRAVIESDRNRALAELDRVKLDLKAAEKAVVDLEEQARRLNVPPGWLR